VRFLLILFLVIGCRPQNHEVNPKLIQASIINGLPVEGKGYESDLYFSAAAIPISSSGFCSGVLISPKIVLTAAHCFKGRANTPGFLYLGHTAFGSINEKYKYEIEDIAVHPDYSIDKKVNNGNDDLAMVFLKKPAKAPLKPIQIYNSLDFVKAGASVHVAGFSPFSASLQNDIFDALTKSHGNYEDTNIDRSSSRKLLIRSVIMASSKMKFNDDHFEVIQYSGGICSGDSGGPTMIRKGESLYLVGINHAVMGREGRMSCENTALSTAVILHKDWILSTSKAWRTSEAEFVDSNEKMDPQESSCAATIEKTFKTFSSMMYPGIKLCASVEEASVMLEEQTKDCQKTCKDQKGFTGQCEFYERGINKTIHYLKEKCERRPR
jgi:secreted trypsin-like serine protease